MTVSLFTLDVVKKNGQGKSVSRCDIIFIQLEKVAVYKISVRKNFLPISHEMFKTSKIGKMFKRDILLLKIEFLQKNENKKQKRKRKQINHSSLAICCIINTGYFFFFLKKKKKLNTSTSSDSFQTISDQEMKRISSFHESTNRIYFCKV